MNISRGMWFALLLLGIAGLVMLLNWQFPGALRGEDQTMRLVYLVVLLTLVCSGVFAGWQRTGEQFNVYRAASGDLRAVCGQPVGPAFALLDGTGEDVVPG